MTTTTESPAARLGGRTLVGGLMLAVMAGWAFVNHEPAPSAVVALLGAAAALAVAVGVLQFRGPTSAALNAVPFLLGAVAALCGAWLAWQFKLEALGESLGLGFFAILAISTGIGLRGAGLTEDDKWSKVLALRPLIGIAMGLCGTVALGAFFYFALIQKPDTPIVSELLSLLLGGFVLFFAGLFLLFSGDPPPSAASIRLFFIIVGSALGVILTLEAIARAVVWNKELFRGGMAAFTGADAWMFWLVAYVFLAGIGLIFASLNLSLSQLRNSPEMRRAMYGYTAFIAGVLMLILLAFANLFISQKAPYTYNWNQTRGLTALNAASKNLLSSLAEPTSVYVVMSPGSPFYNDVRNFVGNCQAYTNKISIAYVDPKNEPRKYSELVTRFKEIEPESRSPRDPASQGVLLVYGALPEDVTRPVPHMFIPERRLFEFDAKAGPGKATLMLKAESEIMKELAFLAKKSDKQKIYLLQDDGALDMNIEEESTRRNPSFDLSKLGAGKLVGKLRKDNFEVHGVSFAVAPAKDPPKDIAFLGSVTGDKRINIPDDCDVLIVPGVSLPVPRAGLDALERYMDRGGKLIVAVDVVTDSGFKAIKKSGLEDFLKKYGVLITDQVLYRFPQVQDQSIFGPSFGDPRLIFAETPAKASTLLAKQLQGMPVRWWSVRAVRPGTSSKYSVEPLLVAPTKNRVVWADDSVAGLVDFDRYFTDLRRSRRLEALYSPEPIPVAVTVSEGSGEAAKPRIVVFGDAEFLSNEDITLPTFEANYDLVASSIEWMSERAFIGPRPKETAMFAFGTKADLQTMVWGSFWTMMVVIVILGVGVWLARRK
jgi:hypothetical protein